MTQPTGQIVVTLEIDDNKIYHGIRTALAALSPDAEPTPANCHNEAVLANRILYYIKAKRHQIEVNTIPENATDAEAIVENVITQIIANEIATMQECGEFAEIMAQEYQTP